MSSPARMLLATSNPGKLREYREMARGSHLQLDLLSNFDALPPFDESAPTFAENSAGKALHYSKFTGDMVLADDSGLAVTALSGAPGILSRRYAGPNATDLERVNKLLHQMQGVPEGERSARFVCVTTVARQGRAIAIVSASVAGTLVREPRGRNGFGYDPIFLPQGLNHTFAEALQQEKNLLSHRGKAFRKVLELMSDADLARAH
jgi:XTP/dITP diphosphohydrolase